jgi:hypothetical protein
MVPMSALRVRQKLRWRERERERDRERERERERQRQRQRERNDVTYNLTVILEGSKGSIFDNRDENVITEGIWKVVS